MESPLSERIRKPEQRTAVIIDLCKLHPETFPRIFNVIEREQKRALAEFEEWRPPRRVQRELDEFTDSDKTEQHANDFAELAIGLNDDEGFICASFFKKYVALGGQPDGFWEIWDWAYEATAFALRNARRRKMLEECDELIEAEERSYAEDHLPLPDKAPDGLGKKTSADDGSQIEPTPFKWIEPAKIPPRQWLYGRHYVRKYTSSTIAASKTGKTSLIIVEALAMATGRALLGIKPTERCKVWLWNGEDPMEELQRRVTAAMQLYSIAPEEVEGWLYVDSGRTQPLIIATQTRNGTMVAVPVENRLVERMTALGIDVLIVDPFISCHRVPENDNTAIEVVAKTWGRIADKTNAAIELPHHIRKSNGSTELTMDDARGGGAANAAHRCLRLLSRMTKAEGEGKVENYRSYFWVAGFGNMTPPPSEDRDWFKIETVHLANGDAVGAVKKWKAPSLFDGNAPGDLLKVQKRISEGEWRESSKAKDWAGNAVAEVLNLDLNDKGAREDIGKMIKVWIDSKALKVVKRNDKNRVEREWIEVGEWMDDRASHVCETEGEPF
jgi:AAA domain